MIRRNLITVLAVSWLQGSALAFQQLPSIRQRYDSIGGRPTVTSLSVQSTETPPDQQQDTEDKDEAPEVPHFAQDDPVKEPRPEVEEEPAAVEEPTIKATVPNVPPPPSAVDLQMKTETVETTTPLKQSFVPPKPSIVADSTFDDAVTPRPPKPSAPTTPPPPSMFAPKDEGPSATVELLEAVRDATVAGTMELLKGLRYATATALTASLPDQQKSQLLSQIKPIEEEEVEVKANEEEIRGSIQEEIALALREEARKNDDQWQKEKEEITKKLEAAAEARMKSELEIQQKRLEAEKKAWVEANTATTNNAVTNLQQKIGELEKQLQQTMEAKTQLEENKVKQQRDEQMMQTNGLDDVEAMLKKRQQQQAMLEKVEKDLREKAELIKKEKEELSKLENVEPKSEVPEEEEEDVPYLSPKEYRSLSPEEKAEIKAKREAAGAKPSDDAETSHPVLGPVVADLGYKRIHLVSSGKLGTIPIWNRQRTYRNDRARRMASDKQASMELGFPGVVCLYEDSKGSLSILDGQHRVGMMQTLRELRNKNGGELTENDEALFENVLVEVYTDSSSNSTDTKKEKSVAEQVFLEINKAEPVKMLDLPGVASTEDRKLITEAVAALKEQFPKMFSTSQRCKSPNVNIDNLRNSIYGANILQRHKDEVSTASQLLNWLLVQNAAVGESYENDPQKQKFISSKAWKKASKNGFYLGLESSWLFS